MGKFRFIARKSANHVVHPDFLRRFWVQMFRAEPPAGVIPLAEAALEVLHSGMRTSDSRFMEHLLAGRQHILDREGGGTREACLAGNLFIAVATFNYTANAMGEDDALQKAGELMLKCVPFLRPEEIGPGLPWSPRSSFFI